MNKTIAGKYEHYLPLFKTVGFRDAKVFFYTNNQRRMLSMIETLKRTIDALGYEHYYAQCFCFAVIEYDRFINALPKLTDRAVTGDYQRAALEPFNFLK